MLTEAGPQRDPLRLAARKRPGTAQLGQRWSSRGVPYSKHGVDKDVNFSWAKIPNDDILLLLFESD